MKDGIRWDKMGYESPKCCFNVCSAQKKLLTTVVWGLFWSNYFYQFKCTCTVNVEMIPSFHSWWRWMPSLISLHLLKYPNTVVNLISSMLRYIYPQLDYTVPSRKLTYPTWGKGKSSSNMPYQGDMLIPWRVYSNTVVNPCKSRIIHGKIYIFPHLAYGCLWFSCRYT